MKLNNAGVCSAGGWHKFNPKKFALSLYENKNNLVILEFFAPTYTAGKLSLSALIDRYKTFVKPLNKLGIKALIHFVNMNDDTLTMYSLEDIKVLFDHINSEKKNINILVPIVECDSNNSSYEIALFDITANWKGQRAYNASGRPAKCPYANVHYLDWHPQGMDNLPPANSSLPYIIDTDCGKIINELRNGALPGQLYSQFEVHKLANRCMNQNNIRMLSIYGIDDSGNHNVYKEAMKGLNNVSDFKEKIWEYWKLKYLGDYIK